MESIKTIGIVGLGNMGLGMALSLQRANFQVLGLDKNGATAGKAAESGITLARDMGQLVRESDCIVLSLPTSAIVRDVVAGEGGIAGLAQGSLTIVDTTTADPEETRALAAGIRDQGLILIDAPVSGGPGGALRGELTMFVGGADEDVEAAMPVLKGMGKNIFHIGATGAGNIAKIVNNLLTAAQLLTAAEAFRMANAAGVKTEQLIEAVNAGSGRSGVTLFNYPNRILPGTFNSGFTMQLMRKDVALAATLHEKLGVDVPVSKVVAELWRDSISALADGEDFNRIVNFTRG
ncbi:3-hydroxyisobutyrate dehydrogenase [Bordetella genomosp. 10]|uniref:3-hydroxyisobutyrate dehydrogenase n=1 Tax=Bordetella genomosp. 10 TaxID=1416804 RepID=A0A261S9Y6_9BORD|nr:NAD(P)-dependent oxidoreductase [Bordetella genomosp. 10]OZI34208.1 3-hydroxyisobutyrate dehydrogenase [Bordetella genomosp. 10]